MPRMTKPGILLGYTGLFNAIKRLEKVELERQLEKTDLNEAELVRTCCETLFWLFAVNEDFKKLIEEKYNQSVFDWWDEKGNEGKIMSGFRFIRNRVTHSYKYYWEIIDIERSVWNEISAPTQTELNGIGGQYLLQQLADYNDVILGNSLTEPLKSVSNMILETMAKFDLNQWS